MQAATTVVFLIPSLDIGEQGFKCCCLTAKYSATRQVAAFGLQLVMNSPS